MVLRPREGKLHRIRVGAEPTESMCIPAGERHWRIPPTRKGENSRGPRARFGENRNISSVYATGGKSFPNVYSHKVYLKRVDIGAA